MIIFFFIAISTVLVFVLFLNLHNFPAPTGNYGVGKTQYYLIDHNRKETNIRNGHRELMLHIWYPIDKQKSLKKSPYDHNALTNIQEFIKQQSRIPLWCLYGLLYTKTYAQDNAPITHNKKTFPVIIATHGAGPMIQQYSWLFEELASHGYIVIGINHPYMAALTRFPDGRVVKGLLNEKIKEGKETTRIWKQEQLEIAGQDIKFVLDSLSNFNEQHSWPLYKKLDLEHIGILGHSAGGSLAMKMCLEDNRIKAGIGLDSGTRGNPDSIPFSTPFLVLLGENSRHMRTAKGQEDYKKLVKLNSLPGMSMTLIMIKNIGHSFTDLPLLLNSTLLMRTLSKFINSKIDIDAPLGQACKALKTANTHVVEFFDEHLKT